MNREMYYRHSGGFGMGGVMLVLLVGVGSAALLGVVYGYAIYYNPIVYINFLLPIFLGGGLGQLVSWAAGIGKVRSRMVVVQGGLIAGIVAEYLGWVVWVLAYSGHEALVIHPTGLLLVIQATAEEGAWSIRSFTPSGIVLYLIWIAEAVIIVGAATLFPLSKIGDKPFCERCNQWVTEKKSFYPFALVQDPEQMIEDLESGDVEGLEKLQKLSLSASTTYTQVDIRRCTSCEAFHLLTVVHVAEGVDSDGNATRQEEPIVDNLIVGRDTFDRLSKSLPGRSNAPAMDVS
jgi:hypothetical protein